MWGPIGTEGLDGPNGGDSCGPMIIMDHSLDPRLPIFEDDPAYNTKERAYTIVLGSATCRFLDRLLDTLLGNKLEVRLSVIFPSVLGFYSGGKKYTQPLDVGHAMTLFLEKALDASPREDMGHPRIK